MQCKQVYKESKSGYAALYKTRDCLMTVRQSEA